MTMTVGELRKALAGLEDERHVEFVTSMKTGEACALSDLVIDESHPGHHGDPIYLYAEPDDYHYEEYA